MKDLHGKAILDYYKGGHEENLVLHNSYGDPESMSIEVFFREHDDFTELENLAISSCTGAILDIGAGAGTHTLFMQVLEMDITALENSPGCIETLRHSGMKNIIAGDYQNHKGKYDTLLLLMNGLGIIGKLAHLPFFLEKCKSLLNPEGQIILDSSDISYLYKDGLKPSHYYGEVRYQYEYKNNKGEWFDWVYVAQEQLISDVVKSGLEIEILMTDECDQYLARITGF